MIGMNDPFNAMEDAERLWPYNDLVVGADTATENAVRQALDGNKSPEFDRSDTSDEARSAHQPNVRLIHVKQDRAPAPFLDALVADTLPNMEMPCDRCLLNRQPVGRLWVAQGASVVQVECCDNCMGLLDRSFRDLVWR